MKKIVVLLGLALVLAGCTSESAYNEQVDRYEKLVLEDAGKKVSKLEQKKADELRSEIYELDIEVKELEDKITKDGKISDEELEKYTKLVDKVEDTINDYK